MIRRYSLLILSVLFSYTVFAQDDTANKPQEPILGYYHLGMNFEEYWSQTQKKKEATEISDSITMQSKYILSIDGIAFNVDDIKSTSGGIGYLEYKNYTKGTSPLYFTDCDYFLENKLVSVTVKTPLPETEGFCYMPSALYEQERLPKNQCLFDVHNVDQHNQLVSLTERLETYLSQKYGKPTKEYSIAKLQPLHQGELFRQFSAHWFSLCKSGAILPKAEWQSGNMKVIMGITNSATIFISFLDEVSLSHQNLDRVFAPVEQPKSTAEW